MYATNFQVKMKHHNKFDDSAKNKGVWQSMFPLCSVTVTNEKRVAVTQYIYTPLCKDVLLHKNDNPDRKLVDAMTRPELTISLDGCSLITMSTMSALIGFQRLSVKISYILFLSTDRFPKNILFNKYLLDRK